MIVKKKTLVRGEGAKLVQKRENKRSDYTDFLEKGKGKWLSPIKEENLFLSKELCFRTIRHIF